MDCRVKPGNDGGWVSANRRWDQSSGLEKGLQCDEQNARHRLPVRRRQHAHRQRWRAGAFEQTSRADLRHRDPRPVLEDFRTTAERARIRRLPRRILAAVKKIWGKRVTTVFPKQGHYALDPKALAEYPAADIELAGIGDLLKYDLAALLRGTSKGMSRSG